MLDTETIIVHQSTEFSDSEYELLKTTIKKMFPEAEFYRAELD